MPIREMSREDILGEIEDVIRTAPERSAIRDPANFAWLGRASAVLNLWDPIASVGLDLQMSYLQGHLAVQADGAYAKLNILLQRARSDLRMKTLGPVNAAIGHGRVFDYFDEIRKILTLAKTDVFFIDQFLDADFVSRYLDHVPADVNVRLLGRKHMDTLVPAVKLFAQQSGKTISVRKGSNFHDRFVIVDHQACYHSGASFKDGGRFAPTTITQITDAFSVVQKTYEDLWSIGSIEI